jgi:hypothetical protein
MYALVFSEKNFLILYICIHIKVMPNMVVCYFDGGPTLWLLLSKLYTCKVIFPSCWEKYRRETGAGSRKYR